MPSDRLETLLQFVESNPKDAFVRHGLAQEYVNRGQLEKAIEEFNTLMADNADYQAAYYHAGQHRLMKTGGRLVKHARYYWLLLAEGHLNRRLFGDMLHRIWALPPPSG